MSEKEIYKQINRKFYVVSDKFRKFPNAEIILPKRGSKNSAGYDFFLVEDIEIPPGETVITWTDVCCKMQDDEVLKIYSRSSLGIKRQLRLANGTGIVDCVPKGTNITTPNGNKKIEDIFDSNVPEIIFSFNEEEKEVEEDMITDIWIVNDLPLIEIETEEGDKIKLPENKEIYTERGWIKIKNLTICDKVLKF